MKQPLKMADVKNMDQEQKFKTVGGEQVSFRNTRKISSFIGDISDKINS